MLKAFLNATCFWCYQHSLTPLSTYPSLQSSLISANLPAFPQLFTSFFHTVLWRCLRVLGVDFEGVLPPWLDKFYSKSYALEVVHQLLWVVSRLCTVIHSFGNSLSLAHANNNLIKDKVVLWSRSRVFARVRGSEHCDHCANFHVSVSMKFQLLGLAPSAHGGDQQALLDFGLREGKPTNRIYWVTLRNFSNGANSPGCLRP